MNPTKTMKTMKKYLSMAALALMGAMMTGCSNDDNFDNPQQPENKNNVVTLTTTVGLDGGATTRALTSEGVKTFAVNDQIAVIYTKNGGTVTKAVSEKLISTDIASGSKSATFTVTLDDPDKTKNVTYIYPAAMAGEMGVDLTKLNTQEGTFEALQSKYDLCTKSGAWDAGNLPSLTLENQLAILAITLKDNAATPTEITSITSLTISDGTNTYTVSRSAAAGPIYVAIRPTASAAIDVTATNGTNYYIKSLTGKTYAINNGYNVSWRMTELSEGTLPGKFTINAGGNKVRFSQGNLQYTQSTSTWSFMEHQYSTVETNGSPYCSNNYGDKDVVSLFSWATSGYSHGATSYQPNSTNPNNENYYAYGYASYNLYNQTGQADWGYNAISNGGNTANSGWRTLTTAEWQYLFANHTTGWSTVNSVNGYVIRPDGVSTAIATSYTASDWATEEAAGSVFLPAAGYRSSYLGTYVYYMGSTGRYWSSSCHDTTNAYNLYFTSSKLETDNSMNRYYGESVRLVRAVE